MRYNVVTQKDYEQAMKKINRASVIAVDTETNGLHPFGENQLIGISVYIPETDDGFYFPFRHGHGRVEVRYTSTNTPTTDFEDMTWQGATRNQLYLSYWFQKYDTEFWNLPLSLIEDMHDFMQGKLVLMHNAQFDLNFLHKDGFTLPDRVFDTMISLHLVNEDWHGIEVTAPYTWSWTDTRKGLCSKDDKGLWARGADGELLKKKQFGNRRLKWVSAFLGFDRATEGEEQLREARIRFEDELTDFIMDNLDDPINDSLRYKNDPKPTGTRTGTNQIKRLSKGYLRGLRNAVEPIFYVDKNYKSWEEGWYEYNLKDELIELIPDNRISADMVFRQDDYNQVFYDMVAYGKQWDRIRAKVALDEKANMWMLPSADVWDYAVLDVELTSQLQDWCMRIIEDWDNVELHGQLQDTQYELAWRMQQTGFTIDPVATKEQIKLYDERIAELEEILSNIAFEYEVDAVFEMGSDDDFNPHSHQQLLTFLQSGVLTEPMTDIFPSWYPKTQQVGLKTYEAIPEGTARASLEDFEDHPLVKLVQELKKLKKSSDVYLKNWYNQRDENNVVHFNFETTGTVAGRWSSRGGAGNAQNIPDRNGYRIKEVVVPPSDEWALIAFDYGQLEARLASWIAEGILGFGNNEMTDLFNEGADMHTYVAHELEVKNVLYPDMSWADIATYNGVNYEKMVNSIGEEDAEAKIFKGYVRQVAKTCNFGLLYSGTEWMLSKLLKIELDVARVLVYRWRELFPAFGYAQDYYTNRALQDRPIPSEKYLAKYVTQPLSGRHRKFHKYSTWAWFYEDGVRKGFNPREASAKKAWNNVVQGLGGWMCTESGKHIVRKYPEQVRLFANIHDALDGYIRKDSLHIIPDIKAIMSDYPTNPPLTVDAEYSETNWQNMGELHES